MWQQFQSKCRWKHGQGHTWEDENIMLCVTTSCEFANNKPKDKEKTWTISTVSEFIKARKRLQYPETSLSSYMLLYIF